MYDQNLFRTLRTANTLPFPYFFSNTCLLCTSFYFWHMYCLISYATCVWPEFNCNKSFVLFCSVLLTCNIECSFWFGSRLNARFQRGSQLCKVITYPNMYYTNQYFPVFHYFHIIIILYSTIPTLKFRKPYEPNEPIHSHSPSNPSAVVSHGLYWNTCKFRKKLYPAGLRNHVQNWLTARAMFT